MDEVPASLLNPKVPASQIYNNAQLVKLRTMSGLLLGITAGVAELEGLAGLGLFCGGFAIVSGVISLFLWFSQPKYFEQPLALYVTGSGSSLAAFVLAWVLVYNLV